MDSLDGQYTGVGPGRDLADPGSPGRPEGAPYLGGISPVDRDGVVGRGGPLIIAYRARRVRGRAGVHQQRYPVHVHQAAQGVRVRVRRELVGAGRTDVGQQVPAAR